MKFFNQISFHVVSKQKIILSFMLEVTSKNCFTILQDLAPPTNMKTYPELTFENEHNKKNKNPSIQQLPCLSICKHQIRGSLEAPKKFLCSPSMVQTLVTLISSQHLNNISNVRHTTNLSIHKASINRR